MRDARLDIPGDMLATFVLSGLSTREITDLFGVSPIAIQSRSAEEDLSCEFRIALIEQNLTNVVELVLCTENSDMAERLLLIGCLLQGVVCRHFSISLPDSIKTLSGSCVLIPCTFDIPENYEGDLTDKAKGIWYKDQISDHNKVFDSGTPDKNKIRGEIIGDLTVKNCTTVLYDFSQKHSGEFIFRLEGLNGLKYNFAMKKVQVTATDDPPKVSLRPDKVEVMEGESVRFNCSAEASCPSLGPMLTWSPRLNMSEEKLQEKISPITHMTSVLTFTATPLHHGETITCTATYQLKNNQTNTSARSATLNVLYSPRNTSVSVSPSGWVLEGSSVTLTCLSDANPAVHNYTWYRVRGTEMEFIVTGQNLTFNKTDPTHSGQYRCEAQNAHGVGNATAQLDIQFAPQISVSSGCKKSEAEMHCVCESRGSPSPRLEWYLSGHQITNSSNTVITEEPLGEKGLKSSFTMCQSQKDTPTLLCLSTNTLGSASLLFASVSTPQSTQVFLPGIDMWSLLIGAAAGAITMMLLCFIVHFSMSLVEAARMCRYLLPEGRRVKWMWEGWVGSSMMLSAFRGPVQAEESLYVNKSMLSGPLRATQNDTELLHYAAVEFTKYQGQGVTREASDVAVASSDMSEYAAIHHHCLEQNIKSEIGGMDKPEAAADLVLGSTGGSKGQTEPDEEIKAREVLMSEEPTYGNIGSHKAVAMETEDEGV
ncbi:sialic acid-binding Ig-like lectin 10 [Chanos chanos]|uniref:Sialic acid-binding Ig-like lectin 10 n=1 Tax=Chanos chanos TaxID=29144 RepID=A0A6J2WRC5_CHACN|nr:sialic acid-binding Ig-like lectin 10 [Chanos chanos]